jgi:hypothetical protein
MIGCLSSGELNLQAIPVVEAKFTIPWPCLIGYLLILVLPLMVVYCILYKESTGM